MRKNLMMNSSGRRVITNQATGGNSEQAHLPFGKALNAESTITNNNKRFTSYNRSAPTGLDYAVNRTYDSKQGRFTQVDPIGMGATSLSAPQTLNLYTYCGNDPINHTDPSGLFWGKLFSFIKKAWKWIVAIVVVALVIASLVATHGGSAGLLGHLGTLFSKLGLAHFIAGEAFHASLGIAGKVLLGIAGVGAIANSFAQTKSNRQNGKCDHWLLAYYDRFKGFFDKLWQKTQNTKSAEAPDGIEAGGIASISSEIVSPGGVEAIGWEIYDGPGSTKDGMGDEFDNKWTMKKKIELGLRQGGWASLIVHTHPSGSADPSGPGDKGRANNSPEAIVGATEITVFKGIYRTGGRSTGQVICRITR